MKKFHSSMEWAEGLNKLNEKQNGSEEQIPESGTVNPMLPDSNYLKVEIWAVERSKKERKIAAQ